jgi:dolichyl-phosphate-mannose--protein O-mannosyl transferase
MRLGDRPLVWATGCHSSSAIAVLDERIATLFVVLNHPPFMPVPVPPPPLHTNPARDWKAQPTGGQGWAIAWLGLGLVALGLRLWGLGRFNTLVFDEIYFVKYANNYLNQVPFFDSHPPLSKYLIAIGIWLGRHWGDTVANAEAGSPLTTISYRWLNAVTGSLLPLVLGAIAWELTRHRGFALLTGALLTLDGLYLVESRYGLNNVYLVGLGLLGVYGWLRAVWARRDRARWGWLTAAGIAIGGTVAVKWNGLGFGLAIALVWFTAWCGCWLRGPWFRGPWFRGPWFRKHWRGKRGLGALRPPLGIARFEAVRWRSAPLGRAIARISPAAMIWMLGVVPAIVYGLVWIPHLQLNSGDTFWDLQRRMLTYHQNIGSGPDTHPYCSRWYTWPLLLRPIAYFYAKVPQGAPLPVAKGSPLPPETVAQVYDVHALGNPILWWSATGAIALILLIGVAQGVERWLGRSTLTLDRGQWRSPGPLSPIQRLANLPLGPGGWPVAGILLTGYGTNWLPWAMVSRCTFLYHYMGALAFAILLLAWVLVGWWIAGGAWRRRAIALIAVIAIAFLFWLPIYWGWPLSPRAWQLRLWHFQVPWLPQWI